jgi:hypothetical protein
MAGKAGNWGLREGAHIDLDHKRDDDPTIEAAFSHSAKLLQNL